MPLERRGAADSRFPPDISLYRLLGDHIYILQPAIVVPPRRAQQRGGRTVRVPRDRAERSTGSASERAYVDMSDSYLTGITIVDVSREPRKVTGHSQCFGPDGKVGFFQERCLS